jgi:hypothetical protein
MKFLCTLLVFFLYYSCSNKKEKTKNLFHLEILNDSLVTYYHNNLKEKDTIIKLVYKLTNLTENNYYFNLDDRSNNGIPFDEYTKYLKVIDDSLIEEIKSSFSYHKSDSCFILTKINKSKKLEEYVSYIDKKKSLYSYYNRDIKYNFFIYANETIYFESLLKIYAKEPLFEESSAHHYLIKKDKKYFAKLILSVNGEFKDFSKPWYVLKTIKENNYIKFTGTIESINKVPVRVLE